MPAIKSPKKLIETALPLDAINAAAAREKSIRHGHPSTLHLWWARRPLAAARAVIFAQMVNDPGYEREYGRGVNKEKAAIERERLFKIIEDLVKWENTTNEEVLERARAEIRKSWQETCKLNREHPQAAELFNPDKLPGFHDPFAGGGALPLEAQRLGLEAWASDLNPVAVTINKAMIEIPPKFAGRAPVGPVPAGESRSLEGSWSGARGLAEDVRRYGAWMREEARKRIGHLYPQVEITADMAKDRQDLHDFVGKKLTVIAWLWARTVKSPNPLFADVDVPLASTFVLSSKAGKEAYVQPVVEGKSYRFTVKMGTPPEGAKNGTKLARGAKFSCLLSGTPINPQYIYSEAQAKRLGVRLMAIVAEGKQGRVYLDPNSLHENVVLRAAPQWQPTVMMPDNPRWFSPPLYGLTTFGDLFTPRQLVALTTFSDLVHEAMSKCEQDALAAGMAADGLGLDAGGLGAKAYAEAVGVYLAFAVDKVSDYWSSICSWHSSGEKMRNTFGRQAIPMVWDYAESNAFCSSSGNWMAMIDWCWKALTQFPNTICGFASQRDAQNQHVSSQKIVSTDPPYYDNIGYADLSDFFYVWLRRSLQKIFPDLYKTVAVPKVEELIASPYRHKNRAEAETFFLDGMTQAIHNLAQQAHPAFPVTIYYAFKQSETSGEEGTSSTGWETFLAAVLQAGFSICGTWPMRTELGNRMISSGTNALASSIVLVCRKRPDDAPTVSRRNFLRELNEVLPVAFSEMTCGGVNSPVAPVDLSQAIIGPGMAVFSKYKAVLEADGTPMSVKAALRIINRFFGGDDDFDADTLFCLQWVDMNGWAAGKFGEADVLARAKGTSAGGLAEAGVVSSGGGEVRLLRWQELAPGWNPATDSRTPVWEALHQMIRTLNEEGETACGKLLVALPLSSGIRALAYRLYTLCERKGWAEDARAYNELVVAWPNIEQSATSLPTQPAPEQGSLL